MGNRPFHHEIWRVARAMIALATVLALVIAPLVVILTHGPAAHYVVTSMSAEMAEDIDAHGHAHGDTGHDHEGGSFGGHNPADHDHQLHALACHAASASSPRPDKAHCTLRDVFRHLTPEGPRRPPRHA